jgi:hypothetical protein
VFASHRITQTDVGGVPLGLATKGEYEQGVDDRVEVGLVPAESPKEEPERGMSQLAPTVVL